MRAVSGLVLWFMVLITGTLAYGGDCKVVSAPEVKKMMEQDNTVLVHTLSSIEYAIQHIPRSINIPADKIGQTGNMPEDRNHPVIFYCMGVSCPYSERACDKALSLGYRNTFWFRGGIPEWYKFDYAMFTNRDMLDVKVDMLSPQYVSKVIAAEQPFILDVRPRGWELSEKYIQGSVAIPLIELDRKLDHLPNDRKILIADGVMKQSVNAARFLSNLGYTVIGVVKGGVLRWEKEGYPVVGMDGILFP